MGAGSEIYNFGKVNDGYYRGAQPLDGQYADLAALGIKTIINLTSGPDVREDEEGDGREAWNAVSAHSL